MVVLILGKKILRERLSINLMEGLKSTAVHGLGQNTGVAAEGVAVMTTITNGDLGSF